MSQVALERLNEQKQCGQRDFGAYRQIKTLRRTHFSGAFAECVSLPLGSYIFHDTTVSFGTRDRSFPSYVNLVEFSDGRTVCRFISQKGLGNATRHGLAK